MNQKELQTHLQSLHNNCRDLFEFWVTYSQLHKAYSELSKAHLELQANYEKKVSYYEHLVKQLRQEQTSSHESCKAEINSLRRQLNQKISAPITPPPTVINSPTISPSNFKPIINSPPQQFIIPQPTPKPARIQMQQSDLQPSRVQTSQPILTRFTANYANQCLCPCPDPNNYSTFTQNQPFQFPNNTLQHSKSQIITPINMQSSYYKDSQPRVEVRAGNLVSKQEECEICRNALSGKGPFTPHSHGLTFK